MAKIDAELLKKHHFWILLIPYSLLVGLAILFVWTDVGEAASKKEGEVAKALTDLKAQQPKSEILTAEYGTQKSDLEVRRTKLWKATWEEQAPLFVWPKALVDQRADIGSLKFGTMKLTDQNRQKFVNEDVYMKEYIDLVNSAFPIQFGPANRWNTVLQPVEPWRQLPEEEEIWLAMEDLWVRQQMVAMIDKVNRDVGRFAKVPNAPDLAPGEVLWRSRIWELTLKIESDKGAQLIKGKIKNITDRIQPLGVRNVMFLRLLPVGSKPSTAASANDDTAVGFPIEGELVKAGDTMAIKTLKEHRITDGNLPAIGQIEQVFDARTAPIKRIDRIALGYHSSRTMSYPLKMSEFSQKIVDAAAALTAATATATPGNPGTSMPGMTAATMGRPAGGTDALAANFTGYGLVRDRYIEMTTQVRRMPVGLLVVADQHYLPDLLTAATNTPLRFQTTQSNVKRYEGEIDYSASGTQYSGSTTAVVPKDSNGAAPVVTPMPIVPMGSGIPMAGTTRMSAFNRYGRLGSGTGTSADSFGSRTNASFSNDAQFSANLVEFGLYGIVTLYEKFQTEAEIAADKEAAAKTATAAKK